MDKKTMKKVAMLQKLAWAPGGDLVLAAASAVVAASFLGGLGVGAAASKLTEPGEYDMKNLEKEQELARLHRDNQTQEILAAREEAERRMRGQQPKSMRIG